MINYIVSMLKKLSNVMSLHKEPTPYVRGFSIRPLLQEHTMCNCDHNNLMERDLLILVFVGYKCLKEEKKNNAP